MTQDLINRLRKQREVKVVVGHMHFIALRPTSEQMLQWHRNGASDATVASECVIGWSGVTEDDIAGGGGTDQVPFSRPLWEAWCPDRHDFWAPITAAVMDAYALHQKRIDDAGKN